EQVVLPTLASDENLAGITHDFLNRFDVQTLACHLRRLAILGHQLGEAIRLTLGARDHRIAITGGLFKHPLGLTTRLGNYPIGVGFSLVLLALLIFTSTNHVIKGFLDFARRS